MVDALFKPFHAQLNFGDGSLWQERDYQAVMASTVDQIGMGFRPFIRCEERPHAFHLVGVTADAVEVGRALPRIRMGLPLDPDAFRSAVTDEVTFRSSEPIAYTIDGDMHTSDDGMVRLSAGPRVEMIIK